MKSAAFLGQFHPLLVHLPIGGLLALGVLELLAKLTRWKFGARNTSLILSFVSVAACFCAAGCWVSAGRCEPPLSFWHRGPVYIQAAACVFTLVLYQLGSVRGYRIALLAFSFPLALLGHTGDLLRAYRHEQVETPNALMQQPAFESIIAPILRQRCVECHGPERHKAELRLDSFEAMIRGGQNGAVIRAGDANNSPLVQRLLRPLEADGHMPPEDQPQASVNEVALLQWWINAGASATQSAWELAPGPEIRLLIERMPSRAAPGY